MLFVIFGDMSRSLYPLTNNFNWAAYLYWLSDALKSKGTPVKVDLPEPMRKSQKHWKSVNFRAKGVDITGQFLNHAFQVAKATVGCWMILSQIIAERKDPQIKQRLALCSWTRKAQKNQKLSCKHRQSARRTALLDVDKIWTVLRQLSWCYPDCKLFKEKLSISASWQKQQSMTWQYLWIWFDWSIFQSTVHKADWWTVCTIRLEKTIRAHIINPSTRAMMRQFHALWTQAVRSWMHLLLASQIRSAT